jgi:hypothetical protein
MEMKSESKSALMEIGLSNNLILPLLFFLISCGSKSGVDTAPNDTGALFDDEEFNEFFVKFTKDSLFQIERVKFPWRVYDYDGEVLKEINRADWRYSKFSYDEEYATRQVDAYTKRFGI